MAGVLNLGKGAQPAQPSSGNCVIYVLGSGSSLNNGIVQAFDASGIISYLSPNFRGNYLRNSGFWFAQAQAPGTATNCGSTTTRGVTVAGTGANAGSADGWGVWNENANTTYRRVDTNNAVESGLQSRYYGEYLKVTSTGKIAVAQCLEGSDTGAIRGRTVRFQLRMRSTVGMTVRLGLIQLNTAGTIDTIPATYISAAGGASVDPTLGTNLAYIAPKSNVQMDNCTANGNACDCTLTTAWQRFGGLFDVPTNAKNLFVSVWSNAQIAAADGFRTAETMLTDGFEIQDFSPEPMELEFARCRRAMQRSFAFEIAPAQNAGTTNGEAQGIAGKATAVANAGFIPVRFQPQMRGAASPTITLFNPAAANALMRNITGAADMGATVTQFATNNGFVVNATGVAATAVGDLVAINWFANSEL